MELERWCGDCRMVSALLPVGGLKAQNIPQELDGMMAALLLQGSEMGEDLQDALAHEGLTLPDMPYRVVQFALDDPRILRLEGRFRHYCRLNMYRALQTHLAEALEDSVGGFLVMMMGGLFAVLYTEPEEDSIPEKCRDAVDYARERLDFSVHVTISGLWQGIGKAETAYRMLQDIENSREFFTGAIDRVFIIPPQALDRISDAGQRTEFEQTFFQTAERICGAVRAEDQEAAAQYIRQQLWKIAQNSIGLPYPTAMNLTINRFLSLLQYRLVDQDLANWRHIAQADYSRCLVSCGSLEQYLDKSREIARELVEHARERKVDRRDTLLRDIRAYVVDNATDINMGLTAVAREFRLKPREAAETFRQYYGESINDVIHKTRVKKAKELLLTTNTPVQDIAQAVGYCSLATMYRAFTNVEGVAPGKLRQNKLHD